MQSNNTLTALQIFWRHSNSVRNIPIAFKGESNRIKAGFAVEQQSGAKQLGIGGPYSLVLGLRLMKILDSAAFYTLSGIIPVVLLILSGRSCYISIFQVYFKYSSCILFEFLNVRFTFGDHSGRVLTSFERPLPTILRAVYGQQSSRTRKAFQVHSKYSDCILTALQIFLLCSNYNRAAFESQ